MRVWLLAGLAAALTLVAVARADLGDSTEVEDAVGEKEDRLRVRREDKPPPKPRSKFCPGCYSLLSKPATPVRARRQVEKQQRPRPRPRPGPLSLLKPAKVEVQDSEVRTRREVERQPRPGPRPNPPGHSPYKNGYMILLAPPANVSLQDNYQQERVKREGQKPQRARPTRKPTWRHGYGSILGMIHLEEFITLPTPELHCPSCQGSVATGQENHQQERVKREGQKPQRARPTKKPTWRTGFGSILGLSRSSPEEVEVKVLCTECHGSVATGQSHLEEVVTLPTPELHCPSCQGSVATGQEGRSAEGILSRRSRREDERPTVAKRKAKERARDGLYCAGCYSSLTLRDQTASLREAADGGSSGD